MKLPYRLPARSSSAQEMMLSLLLASLGASLVVSHWFAARMGSHPGLGPPLLEGPEVALAGEGLAALAVLILLVLLARTPAQPAVLIVAALLLPASLALATGRLYPPLAWTAWRAELVTMEKTYPALVSERRSLDRALLLALAGALALAALRSAALGSREGDTQGSARFATSAEISKLALRAGRTGIVIGGEKRLGRARAFHAPDRRHVGIFGPSGCGKTSKVIIPTLLAEPASMVVLDIKRELHALTADHRREAFGHTIHAFAPSIKEPWVSGYNPLLDIPKGPQEVAYAQALALALVDPEGQLKTPDFWNASAHSLLTAAILHTLYVGEDKSLAGVNALLASSGEGIKKRLNGMRETEHDPELTQGWADPETGDDTPTHPVVLLEAAKLLDLAAETWTGIVATARSKLTVFLDPIVAANTRAHDFSLAGLGRPGNPTTVYLIIPARDIGRLSGLLRIVLQNLSFHLTGGLALHPDAAAQVGEAEASRELVLVLDELAAVGKLDLIARQIAFLRGYGIQVVAAVQTANQLYQVYGEHENVRGNLAYLLVFPSTEQKTAEEISRLLGDQTLYVESRSRSTAESVFASRRSVMVKDQKRPLLTADEVRRLANENPILVVTGAYPVWNEMRGWWEGRPAKRSVRSRA